MYPGVEWEEPKSASMRVPVPSTIIDQRLFHMVVVAGGGSTFNLAHGVDQAHQEEPGEEAANLRESA